jgi:hypothetical protein
MARVHLDGNVMQVVRLGETVTLGGARGATAEGKTLRLAQAQELCGLLDKAMRHDTPGGIVGLVLTVDGRRLFVKRSAAAVSLTDHPHEHAAWNARLLDQVRGLRDAIAQATGDANTR